MGSRGERCGLGACSAPCRLAWRRLHCPRLALSSVCVLLNPPRTSGLVADPQQLSSCAPQYKGGMGFGRHKFKGGK